MNYTIPFFLAQVRTIAGSELTPVVSTIKDNERRVRKNAPPKTP